MPQRKNLIEQIEEDRQIAELQEKYEKGIIREEQLKEEEKQRLIGLYQKQIEVLEKNNAEYKKILKAYDEEILRIRKKIKGKN